MSDIECPYCDTGLRIYHDDGFGFKEDVAHEYECFECGKNFVFFTSILYNYQAFKADCLNGDSHDLRITENSTLIRRSCKNCDYAENEWKNS